MVGPPICSHQSAQCDNNKERMYYVGMSKYTHDNWYIKLLI